jgi:hypothetical protein
MATMSKAPLLLAAILLFVLGYFIGMKRAVVIHASPTNIHESFTDSEYEETCQDRCPEPDPSKWVLKATVSPCPPLPDMSKYMLKTECPPQPDMSKYILKSSVPACPPCISTCSKPCKIGECPPCPRARCPTVKCPEPKACPACPAVSCPACDEPKIQCKAQYETSDTVRPMLASTKTFGF